ncbi:MAG: C40 family peptidase [Candidatus Aminicenantes bacterium]|nr:C40 family peptidase [Candidatus Aminicenantes bacterium]
MCWQSKKSISKASILWIAAVLALSCNPGKKDLATARSLIDSLRGQAIADSRVELFSVEAEWSGGRVLLTGKTTRPDVAADLVKRLKERRIACSDTIIRLPDPALGEKNWGLVTLSVANIRYQPAHAAEMATQALMGTPVRVLQEEDGWYLVQTPDRYIAWTEAAGIALKTQAQMDAWKGSARLIFLGDSGLILEGTEAASMPVSDIVSGGIVVKEAGMNGRGTMQAVQLPDGRQGFVSGPGFRDFEAWGNSISADPAVLVDFAQRMKGRPYLWGGTSVKGFDCSGFTKTVYLTGGLILARDASQQALQGTTVIAPAAPAVWQGLKAGDLLFFGRKANGETGERVSHVGMYMGDSRFIHCSGMVRVNSLDATRADYEPFLLANLLHVKRIIGAGNGPAALKTHPWYNR